MRLAMAGRPRANSSTSTTAGTSSSIRRQSYWPGITTFVAPRSVYLDNWSFKWGLNYKFDWGKAAPVVTKY